MRGFDQSRGMLRTRALAVPWRACLWLRRNLGSVPFREGYLDVLGFLILLVSRRVSVVIARGRSPRPDVRRTHCGEPS